MLLALVLVVVLLLGGVAGSSDVGDAAMQKAQYDVAIQAYSKVILDEPNKINYYKRSLAYLFANKHELALNDADKVVELDPAFSKGFLHRGKILARIGECKKAQEDFEKARAEQEAADLIQDAQKCARLVPVAEELYKKKDWGNLNNVLQEIIQVSPNYRNMLEMEMEALLETKDFERLIASSGKLLMFDKNNMQAYLNRGRAYYLTGNDEMALKYFFLFNSPTF
jgi:tetratricopeptide (TPR) repeat protein